MNIEKIKEKILLHKDGIILDDSMETDFCCVCHKKISMWFYGIGTVCSSECGIVRDIIFSDEEHEYKEELKQLRKRILVGEKI